MGCAPSIKLLHGCLQRQPGIGPLPLLFSLARDCFLGLQRNLGDVLSIAAVVIRSNPLPPSYQPATGLFVEIPTVQIERSKARGNPVEVVGGGGNSAETIGSGVNLS